MKLRPVAIRVLAVLCLVGPVWAQRNKSETGYDEIQAKKKQEQQQNQTPTPTPTPTPTKPPDCDEISTTLDTTHDALEKLSEAAKSFATERETVTSKIQEANPILEKYTANYLNCVKDDAVQQQLLEGLLAVRTPMIAAANKLKTALLAVPQKVRSGAGPTQAMAEYDALAVKANVEISALTYTGKNMFACAGKFLQPNVDTELASQWLVAAGESLQKLSDASDAMMKAGNGEIAEIMSSEKNAVCQSKMQEFYDKKGGKYAELIDKNGDKNKLNRKARLKSMDPENYLVESKRVDEKLDKVTIKSGDSLWSIAKGMVQKSNRSNANVNKMMNKLIAALKKKQDKTNPSKLASGTTIDLDDILAENDA